MNERAYLAKLELMHANACTWLEAHPGVECQIQFCFPPWVDFIAPISVGVEQHLVSCNEAGLELLKALGPWGVPEEPTVLMTRAILESLYRQHA